MTPSEMKKFIDDRVADCERRQNGSKPGMLANLTKRIAAATDKGLASAVFWHRWMNYGEACQCRDMLAKRIAQ